MTVTKDIAEVLYSKETLSCVACSCNVSYEARHALGGRVILNSNLTHP